MMKKPQFIKSASLIILSAVKNGLGQDYKIMYLKRNKNMRVWPSHSVFPGGKLDSHIDCSPHWLKVFFRDPKQSNFAGLINPNSIGTRRRMIKDPDADAEIPLEVSYRLCAIRETFEETGILIAREKDKKTNRLIHMTDYYRNESKLDKVKQWHERVLRDSAKFIDMFVDLSLEPNIYALHEWSNWLTPSLEKTRFDTFFFTCFLHQLPDERFILFNKDENETLESLSGHLKSVSVLKFFTPLEALEKYKRREIKFIPPQLYESNRLNRFKEVKNLAEYSLHRQKYGLEPWLPKFTKDWRVGFLPGDRMYDRAEEFESYSEAEEFEKSSLNNEIESNKRLNRIMRRQEEKSGERHYEIICNIDFDVRSKYFHTSILKDPVQDCSSNSTDQ